jgi:hypothetical protein
MICDECYECHYYWQNNDTEHECQGQEEPCEEFWAEEEVTE